MPWLCFSDGFVLLDGFLPEDFFLAGELAIRAAAAIGGSTPSYGLSVTVAMDPKNIYPVTQVNEAKFQV